MKPLPLLFATLLPGAALAGSAQGLAHDAGMSPLTIVVLVVAVAALAYYVWRRRR